MISFLAIAALALSILYAPLYAAEEIRADRTETTRMPDGVLRVSVGGISMDDPERGIAISADSLRMWISADTDRVDKYLLFGHVSLKDSVRQIRSERLEYDPIEEAATFRGSVDVRGAGRVLTARRVVYRWKQEILDADGAVGLVYPAQGVRVRAEALRYDAAGDSGRAAGDAEVVRLPDPGGDTLYVRADTLRFYEQGGRMRFSGGVQIAQAGMRGVAQTAHYLKQEGRLELEGAPETTFSQEGESGRDSVAISADRILFGMAGGRLGKIWLYRGAQIRMEAPRDSVVDVRSIRADTALVTLEGDRLGGVEATGGVEASLRSGDGAQTDMRGDHIRMAFGGGEVDSLVLEGENTATYIPADGQAVSRLSGRRIAIRFEDGQIRHLLADQEAVCEHTSLEDGEEKIELTGDRVELDFEDGALQRAQSAGGVRGSYLPAKGEAKP